MHSCSYCPTSSPTDFLFCCLTLSCASCLSLHPCPSPDSISLSSKSPTLKLCRRCNISSISHKCTQCKKMFCESCNKEIHKGKLMMHEVVEIGKMGKGVNGGMCGGEIVCGRHELKRNMVMENGNVGCVRCGEEMGMRRVGKVQEVGSKGLSAGLVKQVLEQKRLTLGNDRGLVEGKWAMIEKSAKGIFGKLMMQLEERQKSVLERINTIKNQQLTNLTQLISLVDLHTTSLSGIQQTNLPNKDKILKLKLISIDQNIRIIDRKKRIPEYHIGKLETQSLISAIKNIISIQRIKQDPAIDRRRSSDILQSNRKDRRSQSRDVMTRSRASHQMSQPNIPQTPRRTIQESGMKTRENSVNRLNVVIPVVPNFEKKLTESIVMQRPGTAQKGRMKSEVVEINRIDGEREGGNDDEKKEKGEQGSDKFKSNFLTMKENIRKSSNYFNQRPLTRR